MVFFGVVYLFPIVFCFSFFLIVDIFVLFPFTVVGDKTVLCADEITIKESLLPSKLNNCPCLVLVNLFSLVLRRILIPIYYYNLRSPPGSTVILPHVLRHHHHFVINVDKLYVALLIHKPIFQYCLQITLNCDIQ